jgi:hypothetical protein
VQWAPACIADAFTLIQGRNFTSSITERMQRSNGSIARTIGMAMITYDPFLATVHTDTRYAALTKKMGLPP